MAYPHCCTCTDSPIMGTGSNKVNRQQGRAAQGGGAMEAVAAPFLKC